MKTLALTLFVMVAALGASSASAEDLAATNDLPAAFQAMNVDQAQILTTTQAGQVRGEGGWRGRGNRVNINVSTNVVRITNVLNRASNNVVANVVEIR